MATTSTRLRVHVRARRADVYRALVDAQAVATWMVPDGMTSHVHEFEAREGGAFRISLTYDAPTGTGKTSEHADTYHGHFVRLVPDEQVVEVIEFETDDPAMQGEMTVAFTLVEADGGTDIDAVHDNVPPGVAPADNETGWRMSLEKLARLVEQKQHFNLDDAVALLERTPASLSALLAGLPEPWLNATEGDGSWSPYDVIRHLIQGERTNWLPRARHIMSGEKRQFEPFARMTEDDEQDSARIDDLLATLSELRRENVAALKNMHLTDADLSRLGLHPEFGEVKLAQLLATWVVHDLNHTAQIVRTLAKVYAEAVGPWSAYLSILQQPPGNVD